MPTHREARAIGDRMPVPSNTGRPRCRYPSAAIRPAHRPCGGIWPSALVAAASVCGGPSSVSARRVSCSRLIFFASSGAGALGNCSASTCRVSADPERRWRTAPADASARPGRCRVSRLPARLPLSTDETYCGWSGCRVRVSYQFVQVAAVCAPAFPSRPGCCRRAAGIPLP